MSLVICNIFNFGFSKNKKSLNVNKFYMPTAMLSLFVLLGKLNRIITFFRRGFPTKEKKTNLLNIKLSREVCVIRKVLPI